MSLKIIDYLPINNNLLAIVNYPVASRLFPPGPRSRCEGFSSPLQSEGFLKNFSFFFFFLFLWGVRFWGGRESAAILGVS